MDLRVGAVVETKERHGNVPANSCGKVVEILANGEARVVFDRDSSCKRLMPVSPPLDLHATKLQRCHCDDDVELPTVSAEIVDPASPMSLAKGSGAATVAQDSQREAAK